MWQVLGVEASDGAVIVARLEDEEEGRRVTNTKDDGEWKISQVSPNLALGTSGMAGDARHLAARGRIIAVEHWFKFGEHPSVKGLARGLAEHALSFSRSSLSPNDDSRYRTARPMGVAAILAGLDQDGGSVYTISPGGDMRRWHAVAIGSGADAANRELESELQRVPQTGLGVTNGLAWTLRDALRAALRVLTRLAREAERPTSLSSIRVAVVGPSSAPSVKTRVRYDAHTYNDGWSSLDTAVYHVVPNNELAALLADLAGEGDDMVSLKAYTATSAELPSRDEADDSSRNIEDASDNGDGSSFRR